MKTIWVTQRLVCEPAHGEMRDALDCRWADFLWEAGLICRPFPSGLHPQRLDAQDIDGLLLTGGNDLASCVDDPLARRRDVLEARLIERATVEGWPVIGVCRGMQMLAQHSGARIQALAGHVACRHPLQAEPNSLGFEREVNSFHCYGIREAPAEWRAVARSNEGYIEAMMHGRRPWFAIMWHPEREYPFHPADLAFFRGVFSRCAQ